MALSGEMGLQDGVETSWDLQLIRPGAGHWLCFVFSPSDLISEPVFWQESWELGKGVGWAGVWMGPEGLQPLCGTEPALLPSWLVKLGPKPSNSLTGPWSPVVEPPGSHLGLTLSSVTYLSGLGEHG